MPLIEILPSSTSTSAPGWAYVPDTGPDPSKLAIQPSGARKRLAARASQLGGNSSESTTRQTNAVLKHLAELDREGGGREVQVQVGGRGGRVSKSKTTPAVRRVLTSQKTFANHLADEEAALAAPTHHPPSAAPPPRPPAPKSAKPPAALLKRAATSLPATPAPPASPPASTAPAPPTRAQQVPSAADNANTPLLRSYVPVAPSAAIMEALVSAPPLSYNAARASVAARASARPQRRFCEICGFWGRVRCLKCGARVCGVECMGVHGEGRCLKFYA